MIPKTGWRKKKITVALIRKVQLWSKQEEPRYLRVDHFAAYPRILESAGVVRERYCRNDLDVLFVIRQKIEQNLHHLPRLLVSCVQTDAPQSHRLLVCRERVQRARLPGHRVLEVANDVTRHILELAKEEFIE